MKTLTTLLLALSLTTTTHAVDLDLSKTGDVYAIDAYTQNGIGISAGYQEDAYSLLVMKRYESMLSNAGYLRAYAEFGGGATYFDDTSDTNLTALVGAGLKWEINDALNIKTGYRYTFVDSENSDAMGDVYFGLGFSF